MAVVLFRVEAQLLILLVSVCCKRRTQNRFVLTKQLGVRSATQTPNVLLERRVHVRSVCLCALKQLRLAPPLGQRVACQECPARRIASIHE